MKISYSFGMIDLLHYGHIRALQKAAEGADLRIFGLVSDAASNAWVGNLVSNESERKEVLKSVKYIDVVMRQDTFDPTENLRKIHEQYPEAEINLFHGNDWNIIPAQKYIESIGGKTIILKYYEKFTPLRIIESLTKEEENSLQNVSNLISTKANTLLVLKDRLKKSKIEDIFVFTVNQFKMNADKVISDIREMFLSGKIVIRSSSEREDAFEASNAGHYDSVLNVNAADKDEICIAIEKVIASYQADNDEDDQVLVQRQTQNVLASGVIFTRDIQRNRPYYVINFDLSGSTDSVTSGIGGTSAWMIDSITYENIPNKWKKLMESVKEIENILSGMLLDIEFAITSTDIVVFQVRPLAAAYKYGRRFGDNDVYNVRNDAIETYRRYAKQGLASFSDMAFWNPSEIIGDNPKNLDYSLYRHIITKKAWDEGIVPLGYRAVDKELMYRFGNKPYISLEYSFEALIPAGVSDSLAQKLKDFYINELKKDMSAHDKIEFEIVLNCFDFSTRDRLERLPDSGFVYEDINELECALKVITERNINEYKDILEKDLESIRTLEGIRLEIQNTTYSATDYRLIAKSIHTLLESIVKFGTTQFSRQARCAFIAKSLLKSLCDKGYISTEDYNVFLSDIKTIAVEYEEDYNKVVNDELSQEEFKFKYGHLRSGTYNIRLPRYDHMDGLFSQDAGIRNCTTGESKKKCWDGIILGAITQAMADVDFEGISPETALFFLRKSIEEREYFKFVFTKSLSYVIEMIRQLGGLLHIDLRDLSYLELPEIFAVEYYEDSDRLRQLWNLIIEKRKEIYQLNSKLILPSIIWSEKDFDYIENIVTRPNYITDKKASNEIVYLDDDETNLELEGKIICIEKADPGYDWIFTKKIAGLITKYGGAASHMAIRCAEFMIPAAIGCGNDLFEYAVKSKRLTLDCKHEKIFRDM